MALRELIAAMCSYMPNERPSCAQVVSRLRALAKREGLADELSPTTVNAVKEAVRARGDVPLREHPSLGEVAFLSPTLAREFEPAINERIRAFLAQPNWLAERNHLETLLKGDAQWTAAPILEALDGQKGRLWTRMFGAAQDEDQILAMLSLLEHRANARLSLGSVG